MLTICAFVHFLLVSLDLLVISDRLLKLFSSLNTTLQYLVPLFKTAGVDGFLIGFHFDS